MRTKISKIILVIGIIILSSAIVSCDKLSDLIDKDDNYSDLAGTYQRTKTSDIGGRYFVIYESSITFNKNKKFKYSRTSNKSSNSEIHTDLDIEGTYKISEVYEHEGNKLYRLKLSYTGYRGYGQDDSNMKDAPVMSLVKIGDYINLKFSENDHWTKFDSYSTSYRAWNSSTWFLYNNTPTTSSYSDYEGWHHKVN